MANHRIVIVGGGFGGLNAALGLARADASVTLIDRRNFHVFQPLLYQVATGTLSPGDIAAPIRGVVRKQKNTRVLLGEVKGFDIAGRRVLLDSGAVEYDTLIVAAGAGNHYFGHDEWAAHAPALKSMEDATRVRARIFQAFENAERETDEAARRAWLRFVVVGAGPTGVELAGAIAEIARDTLREDFRMIHPEESEIQLLEGGTRVLPAFPEELSGKAARQLIRLGVRPRTGVRVTAIDETGVAIETASGPGRIETRTVLWAAGVAVSPLARLLAEATGAATDRQGRLRVEPDLSLPGHANVLVLGDMASFEQDGAPLPGLASVAMQQGYYVGKAMQAQLAGKARGKFRYVDKGTMATIGRHSAVALMGGRPLSGLIAWLLWLFVHLLLLVGFQNRVLVALQWGLQYLTFNRGARLIGETPQSHM